MKLSTKVATTFNRTNDILALLASVILIFIWWSVLAEIVMRYFLNRPLIWVVEITEMLLVYIAFLTAAWLLKREGHVTIEIVLEQLKPSSRALINTITSVLCAILCLFVMWYSVETTWDLFQRGTASFTMIMLPKWITLVIVPVGFFLLFIQFLIRAYGYLDRWRASL